MMQHRKLGKNGPEIPIVGFGGWPIGEGMGHVDEATAFETVQAALDRGLTLIDTAQYYKSSEGSNDPNRMIIPHIGGNSVIDNSIDFRFIGTFPSR